MEQLTAIEYRPLRSGEEAAVLTFWTGFVMNSRLKERPRGEDSYEEKLARSTIPLAELVQAVAIARQREQSHIRNGWASYLRTIPNWQQHCYVAVAENGAIPAAVQAWPRLVRDVDGEPLLIGHITHHATHRDWPGQRHISRLLEVAASRLRDEGCKFAILLTHDTSRSLFEHLGWQMYPLPYRWGEVRWPNPDEEWYETNIVRSGYEVVKYIPEQSGWAELARIYDAYNARRPLTAVRDATYWEGYYARRLQGWSSLIIKVARHSDTGEIGGYLIVTSRLIAKREAELVELGILPGHEGAFAPLIYAGISMAGWIDDGMGLYLPDDPLIREYEDYEFGQVGEEMMLGILIGGGGSQVYFDETRRLMALPLASDWNEERIRELCTAPGAVFWLLDDSYKAL